MKPQRISPRRTAIRGLTQAYELREIAHQSVMELRKSPMGEAETPRDRAQAIASLIRAWDAASERIRIIRGRPLPGSLRPKSKPERKGKRQQAIEPANVVDYVEEKPTSSIQTTEPPKAQAAE